MIMSNFEHFQWMAPEVIREVAYDEKIDLWSLGITIIEMMDRVPPHYAIRDEQEFFNVALSDPSPTFTYSYPSMYMRGLVAWLLEESPQSRPNARDVILVKLKQDFHTLAPKPALTHVNSNRKSIHMFNTNCSIHLLQKN